MVTCSELGSALLDCLREVSSLLSHAHSIAIEEQDALKKSDAERIALSYKAQEEVLRRITEADQRAAAVATRLAEAAGVSENSADTEIIIRAAGYPDGELIRHEIERISALAKKVQRENEVNALLLQNGMEIITNCLRAIATDVQPPAYSSNASLTPSEICILSVDKRA